MRRANSETVELIKRWEGLRLGAYRDLVGVLTIGYGHTGPDVEEGMRITEQEAETLLRADLRRFERAVEDMVEVELTDGQFGALVSLAFNIGATRLRDSTLIKLLNEGDYEGAKGEFIKWRRAGGKVVEGLQRRREAEVALWGRGQYVTSNYIEPDPPQSPKVTTTARNVGVAASATGTAGTVVTETAQQLNYMSDGVIIQGVCALLVLVGMGLVLWSMLRKNKE